MDEEKDIFSELVKDKLENYTLPVDDDSWDKIAERLRPASRGKAQRWQISALAVAASILLLLLLFPLNKKTYHHETADHLSGHEETIIQNVPEKEIVQSVSQQSGKRSKVFGKSYPIERLLENELTVEVIFKEEITEENPAMPAKEEPAKETPEVNINRSVSTNYNFDIGKSGQEPSIKHKKRQSIRFSLGSGGNILAKNNADMLQNIIVNAPGEYLNFSTYHKAPAQTFADSRTDDILLYEDYPDATYHLPLSFGITVKKELNRTFSIESGIVYSFLATSFRKDFPQRSRANLQLHYIGIPLNLHTHILGSRSSAWEVYLSTGGMVEKGFLSHFLQTNYYTDNAQATIISNEKIKGLQWSVGISPGIDYRILKNYSIYLEPKLNYYFDNDQPVSARTKHPVVVGINAGIRYSW